MLVKQEIEEFLKVRGLKLYAAQLSLKNEVGTTSRTFLMLVGDSQEDFLAKIPAYLEYDSSYGMQMLYGTIWFTDGTWAEREEYDGSEWWVHRARPEAPRPAKSS